MILWSDFESFACLHLTSFLLYLFPLRFSVQKLWCSISAVTFFCCNQGKKTLIKIPACESVVARERGLTLAFTLF